MKTSYEVILQGVIITVNSLDEVIKTIKEYKHIPHEDFEINEVKTRDISQIVHLSLLDSKTMEDKRTESRKNKKNFDSYYLDNDWGLPYAFDLLYDIKTEGELAAEFSEGISDDLYEMALEYGYNKEYLSSLNLNKN